MRKRIDFVLVVFGAIFVIGSILIPILLLQADTFRQEKVIFTVTTTTTIGPFSQVEPKGTTEAPSYILLFWPAIFFIEGLFFISLGLGLKRAKNLFLGLTFLLMGFLQVLLGAPFPYILIGWVFFISGVLVVIILIRRVITKRKWL